MVIVKVPNRFYNGVIAGVKFVDGVGEFADEKLGRDIAKNFSFEVVESEPVKEVVEKTEPKQEKPKRTRKKVSAE